MKLSRTAFFLGCFVGGLSAALLPFALNWLAPNAHADIKLLPFQGRLTDATGATIPDGAKVVEFKMYDAPTGGNVKWAGEVHKLSVNGGLVNTMLGSKASLGSVDFSNTTFLQITVDANGDGQITAADPPLLPRQSVVPAVYAAVTGQMQYRISATEVASADWTAVFDNGRPDTGKIATVKLAQDNGITANQLALNAVGIDELASNAVTLAKMADESVGTAELIGNDASIPPVLGAVTSDKILDGTIQARDLSTGLQNSVTPPGAVIAYAATTAPVGWLLCDGRAVSRTTYAGLFAVIGTTHGVGDAATTFNLPDYRGRFLRGVDDADGAGGLAAAGRDPDVAARTAMGTGGSSAGNVGSVQEDALKEHKHNAPPGFKYWFRDNTAAGVDTFAGGYGQVTQTDQTGTVFGAEVASETRPKNAYVNYLIKY